VIKFFINELDDMKLKIKTNMQICHDSKCSFQNWKAEPNHTRILWVLNYLASQNQLNKFQARESVAELMFKTLCNFHRSNNNNHVYN
jgi:hypothetical protein